MSKPEERRLPPSIYTQPAEKRMIVFTSLLESLYGKEARENGWHMESFSIADLKEPEGLEPRVFEPRQELTDDMIWVSVNHMHKDDCDKVEAFAGGIRKFAAPFGGKDMAVRPYSDSADPTAGSNGLHKPETIYTYGMLFDFASPPGITAEVTE